MKVRSANETTLAVSEPRWLWENIILASESRRAQLQNSIPWKTNQNCTLPAWWQAFTAAEAWYTVISM